MRILIAVMLLLAAVGSAQMTGTGIGFILGEPTGLSLKSWLSTRSALTLGAAWSFRHDGSLFLWGDYTLHSFNITNAADPASLAFYYGIGAKVSFIDHDESGEDDTVIGARVPLGLMLPIHTAPIDVFLEIVPTLDLAPDTEFGLSGGIGAHLFF